MNRTKMLLATCALALPVPLAIGCGGDEASDRDPQEVLTATFENDTRVSSGVLDVSLDVTAEGEQGGSVTASLSGPFQGDPEDPNAVPQLDLDASFDAEGAGQSMSFEGGLVVTEDNAFVEYQNEAYEVGTEEFTKAKRQLERQAGAADDEDGGSGFREGCERAIEAQGGDPAACDFDPTAWFTNLQNEGSEDVGGAEATHIAGDIDVQAMLNDLLNIGLSVPEAQQQGVTPEMIQGQLDQVAQAVETASFDVYSATEDDTLRGLDFEINIDPSALPGAAQAGVGPITATFDMQLSDVGAEQTIEAPEDPRPISELEQGLGSFGLPGLGTGGADAGAGAGGDEGGEVADCLSEAQTQEEANECLGI